MSAPSPFVRTGIGDVEKYWNARPCNIRHSAQPVGTRQYFDEVESRKYFVEAHIPAFTEFEKWKDKKVLEIGCGIGTDTVRFAQAGAMVTAVDLSAQSISIAKERADLLGLKNINFYKANAEQLSDTVPVERYDLVYSFGVIHHTPHPERAVEQIHRYIDRDSLIKIMVYHRRAWKVLWMIMVYGKKPGESLDQLIARYSEAESGCPVTYSYTMKTIPALLQGFDLIETHIEHIFPYRISDYRNFRYRKVWYFRCLPPALFRYMEKRWGWHLCVTARQALTLH
jgi:2-polyprenyl-3-methyl-5-hydroxy-6-metoxy-1,4-benzoquinol methylase